MLAHAYWLMKSEPHEFAITDLKEQKVHYWDGVRNYEARNFMRDRMRIGDLVVFYHSNADPTGPAGVAKVASASYPDFTQWDKTNKYYDPKATKEKPIWFMVDVRYVRSFPRVITRDELKKDPALTNMLLWKRNRLSITPLTKKEFDTIIEDARKTPTSRIFHSKHCAGDQGWSRITKSFDAKAVKSQSVRDPDSPPHKASAWLRLSTL